MKETNVYINRTNGFTLIELLAVIVILAIIALIATPIILGIINSVKEQTKEISAENYLSAVEQAIIRRNMKEEFKPTICTVISQGLDCEGYDEPLKVEVDGEAPTNGVIYFSNDKVSNGTILNFDNYIKKINNLAKKNVKATTEKTKTTGIVPIQDENGNIKISSEFKIKVNDNSDWLTFFVLSNEGDYVNLIAEQNIATDGTFTSEPQDNNEWYVTSSNAYDNRYGPITAYDYLSEATSNWTNIPIIENFVYEDEGHVEDSTYGYQSIITALDNSTGKYKTTITSYSSDYGNPVTYENMRIRLPYESEVTTTEVGCKGDEGSCPLWMVNYLTGNVNSAPYYNESNGKVSVASANNIGYWLLSSHPGSSYNARRVNYIGQVCASYRTNAFDHGVRPVITILKSDLLRVMK